MRRIPFLRISGLLCLACHALFAADPGYRWDVADGDALTLVGEHGVILALNFDRDQPRPFIYPLNTAGGQPMADLAPADHVHHQGLWWAWKYINGVNFWEYARRGVARTAGRLDIEDVRISLDADQSAEVRMQLAYFPDPDGPQAMEEVQVLRFSAPDADGAYTIDWSVRSLALTDVELGRTPLAHEPGGKPWGGYAGLAYRASQFIDNMRFLDSEGRDSNPEDGSFGLPARWFAVFGSFGGERGGIAFFDHPENPRHPTPWFATYQSPTRAGPTMTFINAAMLCYAPYPLEAGEELQLNYRVRIFTGAPDAAALDRMAADFSDKEPLPGLTDL